MKAKEKGRLSERRIRRGERERGERERGKILDIQESLGLSSNVKGFLDYVADDFIANGNSLGFLFFFFFIYLFIYYLLSILLFFIILKIII